MILNMKVSDSEIPRTKEDSLALAVRQAAISVFLS